MKTISLVMITKNEEAKLKRCLNYIKNFVDEIIIVDTGSTDNTKNIAKSFNAKVYDYTWDNNFSNARNFAISKSTSDWNLILDSDEFITKINYDNLHNFINSNNNIIGKIKIINIFEQDGEIRNSSQFISRLAPKNIYFTGRIHEQLNLDLPRENIEIEVEHDGYLNTNKFERNINLILTELKENPNDSYLLYQAAKTFYNNKKYIDAEMYFDLFYTNCNQYDSTFFKDWLVLYLYTIIKTKNFDKGIKLIDKNLDLLNNLCDFYFACGVFFTELVAFDTEKYINYFNFIELSYLSALELKDTSKIEFVAGTGSFLASFNLGIFYELIGNLNKALHYYNLSCKYNYTPAINKINSLKPI